MSKKDKLIDRFKTLPKDFTFEEAVTLMGIPGYKMLPNGNRNLTDCLGLMSTLENIKCANND